MKRRVLLIVTAAIVAALGATTVTVAQAPAGCPMCFKGIMVGQPPNDQLVPRHQPVPGATHPGDSRPALVVVVDAASFGNTGADSFNKTFLNDQLTCAMNKWRNAKGNNNTKSPIVFVRPGDAGTPSSTTAQIVIKKAPTNSCEGNAWACIEGWQQIGNQSSPATINIDERNFGTNSPGRVDADDLCGRLSHELGHALGLGAAPDSTCGTYDSIMKRGTDPTDGSRKNNSIMKWDVDEVIRAKDSTNIEADCQSTEFTEPLLEDSDDSGGGGDYYCGDDECNESEDCESCYIDCGGCGGEGGTGGGWNILSFCGDWYCDEGESEGNCPWDCGCAYTMNCGCEDELDEELCEILRCAENTSGWTDPQCGHDTNCNCWDDADECRAVFGPCVASPESQLAALAPGLMTGQAVSMLGLVCLVGRRRKSSMRP